MKKIDRNIKKSQAIEVFGSVGEMAAKIGVTPGAISQWQENLDYRQQHEVIGAIFAFNLRRKFYRVMEKDGD